MLTKKDILMILSSINDNKDVNYYITKTVKNESIQYDVLKFINSNRPLEISEFYSMLRKNYNHKKSKLYKNLVKEEFDDSNDVLITLSALNLQIMLYAKKLKDSKLFLKHSRGDEITKVLNMYYSDYNLIPCLKLLKLIKADLKIFEYINKD